MRKSALAAAVACIVLLAGGVAAARVWDDPEGRVSFDAPTNWIVDQQVRDTQTIVLAGNADQECYVMALPNRNTAAANAATIRNYTAPVEGSAWAAIANAITPMFPNRTASVASQSVDTSGFWPVQRAEIAGAERPITASLTLRPGFDLAAFCWTYGGPDATATYEALFNSLSNPNDAQWRTEAEQTPPEEISTAAPIAPVAPVNQQEAERSRGLDQGSGRFRRRRD